MQLLDLMHQQLSIGQQFDNGFMALRLIGRDAEGKRETMALAGQSAVVSDGLFDAMDNDLHLLTGCVDQQDHKIIATESGHHIGVPADFLDQISQGDQHVIARLAAVDLVDALEIIQVEIEQRDRCRLARAELEALLGEGKEAASVLQARESIPGGQQGGGHQGSTTFADPSGCRPAPHPGFAVSDPLCRGCRSGDCQTSRGSRHRSGYGARPEQEDCRGSGRLPGY